MDVTTIFKGDTAVIATETSVCCEGQNVPTSAKTAARILH
jgi:hypothetical protein